MKPSSCFPVTNQILEGHFKSAIEQGILGGNNTWTSQYFIIIELTTCNKNQASKKVQKISADLGQPGLSKLVYEHGWTFETASNPKPPIDHTCPPGQVFLLIDVSTLPESEADGGEDMMRPWW